MIRAHIRSRDVAIHYTSSGAIRRIVDETAQESLQVHMADDDCPERYVRVSGRIVPIREIEEAARV